MRIIFGRVAVVGVALVFGCGDPQGPKEPIHQISETEEPAAHVASVPASAGFSWIVPDELAAMPLPGRDRPLDQDAAFLEQEGIRLLVSLTEEPPDPDTLLAHSIEPVHIPVRDFTPPSLEQMTEFAASVESSVANGRPVGVHCTAGLGRSGTMAAAYLVSTGVSADVAIATVRGLRPGSIETETQEDAIRRFEESHAGAR
jgi:atypical dual specificity phosphatase